MESDSVRLARVEEHQVFIRGSVIRIEKALEPVMTQTQKNTTDILLLKQERRINSKWIMLAIAVVGGLIGPVSSGLWEMWKHIPHG